MFSFFSLANRETVISSSVASLVDFRRATTPNGTINPSTFPGPEEYAVLTCLEVRFLEGVFARVDVKGILGSCTCCTGFLVLGALPRGSGWRFGVILGVSSREQISKPVSWFWGWIAHFILVLRELDEFGAVSG